MRRCLYYQVTGTCIVLIKLYSKHGILSPVYYKTLHEYQAKLLWVNVWQKYGAARPYAGVKLCRPAVLLGDCPL